MAQYVTEVKFNCNDPAWSYGPYDVTADADGNLVGPAAATAPQLCPNCGAVSLRVTSYEYVPPDPNAPVGL